MDVVIVHSDEYGEKMTPLQSDFYEQQFRRGRAVGGSYIRDDTVHFVYRDERFEFSTFDVATILETNGTYLLAKVKALRKLKDKKKKE